MGLAQINIKFTADLRGFSTEMQNSMRRIGALGKELQNTGKNLSLYVSAPLVAAGAAAVKFASDYNESLNKVDVAFGPASASVKEFAKTSLESFGIAEGTALDMASTYGDMATGLGLSQDKASAMSKSLVGLAGDLASFKNISIDVANTALAGIFTGETESLKKLGIVMTEANLQTFALSQGITKQFKDMSQAEKVAVRYNYIMSVTKNSQGDFVRTGGGAANQMRIFQESLKQVAQQLGSVILPAFTKLITFVNGAIKSFSGLSDGTKTAIVAVAGIAAALGPVLTIFGSMLTFVPNLITKVNTLGSSFSGLGAIISANPYTALAIAISAVAGGLYLWYSNQQKTISGQQALNSAIAIGDKAASTEVATLDRLYASSTNLKLGIDERKAAYKSLQDLYPSYFKNIDFENLKNTQAIGIYKELRQAIFDKSRAKAIENELQKRAEERLAKELELKENISKTERYIQDLRKGANVIVLQEANAIEKTAAVTVTKNELIKAQYELLKNQRANLLQFTQDSLSSDEVLLKSKTEYDAKTQKLSENEKQRQQEIIAVNGLQKDSVDTLKINTIAYYEGLISLAQKAQKETAFNGAEFDALQLKIDAYKKKIDAISNAPVNLPRPALPDIQAEGISTPKFSLSELKSTLSYYEDLRDKLSTTSDEYTYWSQQVNNTKIKIAEVEGVDEAKTSIDDLTTSTSTKLVDWAGAISSTVQEFAANIAVSIGETLGNMISGTGASLNGVFIGLTKIIGKFLKGLGEAMIQAGLAGLALKAAFSNPFATIGAGIALIVFSTAMENAMSSAPAFANGGLVGGQSFYGDKILARVNSGELILNQKQQRALYGQMNSVADGGTSTIIPDVRISGQDLIVVFNRAQNKKDRTG